MRKNQPRLCTISGVSAKNPALRRISRRRTGEAEGSVNDRRVGAGLLRGGGDGAFVDVFPIDRQIRRGRHLGHVPSAAQVDPKPLNMKRAEAEDAEAGGLCARRLFRAGGRWNILYGSAAPGMRNPPPRPMCQAPFSSPNSSPSSTFCQSEYSKPRIQRQSSSGMATTCMTVPGCTAPPS